MLRLKSFDLLSLARRKVKRQFGNESGAVLVEFGLLALPFFALVGAILETAILLLASQILDAALDDASRNIRTGEAFGNSYTATTFRTKVCDNLYGMFDCSAVKIYVAPVASFSSANFSKNVVDMDTGLWTDTEYYSNGQTSQVMLARVYYKWPTFLNIFGFGLSSLPDNTYLLSSARLFRNEPF